MKAQVKPLLTFLLLIFTVSQCTKNPTESPSVSSLSNEDNFTEIVTLANEIEQLDESGLTDDSPNAIPDRLRLALVKLDHMLNRVQIIVMTSEIDDAIMLYQEARAAQQRALHASQNEEYRRAFGFVRESRFLAQEAIRIVKGEMTPEELKEIALQKLIEKKEQIQLVLDEVSTLLEGEENDFAQRLYERAVLHLELAEEALTSEELRRAHFHLIKADEYAHRALRILNPPE